MWLAFGVSCLAAFGLWQAISAVLNWPGLSVVGSRRFATACIAFVCLAGALALAIDGSILADLPRVALPGLILGFVASAGLGGIASRRESPVDALTAPAPGEKRIVEPVSIPVDLPDRHPILEETLIAPASLVAKREADHAAARARADTAIPGTLFAPAGPCERAIVLICGAGDNRLAFKWPLVRELNARGIAVLSVDPPGHGDFAGVPTTVENTRRAATAALNWLASRYPAGRLGALGISFGGNQAAWLAANDQRIRALVLVSTPVRLGPVRRRTIILEALAMLLPANYAVFRWGSAVDFWRGWRSMKGYAPGPESLYDMIDRFETPGDLAALGGRPVLIAHGRADIAVPFRNARALASAAGRAELLPVAHGTHLTVILRPEIAARIADWMADSLGGLPVAQPSLRAAV